MPSTRRPAWRTCGCFVPKSTEKLMAHIPTWEQIWRENALQEGLEKGLRGRLLKAIKLGLKLKFGPEGLELIPTIQATTDLDKLEGLCNVLETATSLDELRPFCF